MKPSVKDFDPDCLALAATESTLQERIRSARSLQETLRERVVHEDDSHPVEWIAGVDCGLASRGAVTRAAIAVLRWPELTLTESAIAEVPTGFPYIPGLLSFRELPAIAAAWRQLQVLPQLVLCDGHGIAHPRRFGIASHLGLALNIPTIGVGKSRLVGAHDAVPERRGDWTPLQDRGECVGAVLRTRVHVQPLYVSIGHRVSLEGAVAWVMRLLTRYRLPEPIRHAHRLASGR